jgi:hypothetical protein
MIVGWRSSRSRVVNAVQLAYGDQLELAAARPSRDVASASLVSNASITRQFDGTAK